MQPFTKAYLLTTLLWLARAQDAQDFQCGNPDLAEELMVGSFDIVAPGISYNKCGSQIAPKRIYCHIYAVANDETPKISMYPAGIVRPTVSSSGKLRFQLDADSALRDLGFSQGDSIEAGVNLYIPTSQLKKISVSGVDEVVEIIHTVANNTTAFNGSDLDVLEVECDGVDNQITIMCPNSAILFRTSGVDVSTQIEAAYATYLDVRGVDNNVELKIANGDDVEVVMNGVDPYLLIEGTYKSIEAKAVDGTVRVNGATGCNFITNKGIDSNCELTNETVEITALPCLSDTRVAHINCFGWNSMSTGATVGAAIGILAAIILLGGLLFYLCFSCCRDRQRRSVMPPPGYQKGGQPIAPQPTVVAKPNQIAEAEVISAEIIPPATSSSQVAYPPEKELYQVETGIGYAGGEESWRK